MVATPDLDDWVVAPGKTWPREYEVDLTQGLCLPDLGTPPPPKMFFRWRMTIGDADERSALAGRVCKPRRLKVCAHRTSVLEYSHANA